jgi:hypothetical protein
MIKLQLLVEATELVLAKKVIIQTPMQEAETKPVLSHLDKVNKKSKQLLSPPDKRSKLLNLLKSLPLPFLPNKRACSLSHQKTELNFHQESSNNKTLLPGSKLIRANHRHLLK